MKNTNPIFSLKNFRSFGEEGADFELAPITVLTGCNSAGKSSMVKALLLLNKMPRDRFVETPELKVYSKELKLGRYDKILNHQAKDDKIVFSYKIWSDYLQEDVVVKKVFRENKQDVLNSGSMVEYSIEKMDSTLIYKATAPFESYYNDFGTLPYRELPGTKNLDCISDNYKRLSLVSEFWELMVFTRQDNSYIFESIDNNFTNEEENRILAGLNEDQEKINNIKKQISDNQIDISSYNLEQLRVWWDFVRQWKQAFKTWSSMKDWEETKRIYPNQELFSEKELVEEYLNRVINEIFSPWFTQNIEYVDSSSAQIKRIYSADENNKMNSALKQQNKLQQTYAEMKKGSEKDLYTPSSFLNQWLKKFGIGDRIELVGDEEGGMKAYIIRNNAKTLLADEGYGITQLVSILLNIDNLIQIKAEQEDVKWAHPFEEMAQWDFTKPLLQNNWLLTDYYTICTYGHYKRPNHMICVEEPENHLHPKYQSLLADMFVEAYQKYNIHFIIETHSEYLIRKLQVLVADKENKFTPNDVSLNYVDKDENGISTNRKIEILEDGRLSEPFGPGFFDEATGLSMHLLKMKMESK